MKKIVQFFTISFLLLGLTAGAQTPDEYIHVGTAQLVRTMPRGIPAQTNSGFTASVDPNSYYSNVTNYTGYDYTNEGAAVQTVGTVSAIVTTLVADSLKFIGTGGYTVSGFSFSVANDNAVAVSARANIRLYKNDNGANHGVGTIIPLGSYTFDLPNIPVGANIYTTGNQVIFSFPAGTTAIWAGISFDNVNPAETGTTGATLTQMNNLGQAICDPVNRGSSTRTFFQTTAAGSFNASNPVGSYWYYTGGININLGWEFRGASAVVPVTIEYLHGAKAAGGNTLAWKLGCPDGENAVMTLQRSADGRNFSSVYDLTADAVRCQQEFSYTDSKPMSGINCYRLKIVNADGKASYSNIVSLTDKKATFTLVNVQPNPTSDRLVLNVAGAQNDKVQISVHDMNGRQVLTQTAQITAGSNPITVDVSKLQAGTYTITALSSAVDGVKESIGFIKK